MTVDLLKFCADQYQMRFFLMKPFSAGEYSYATNGHVAVRVPRRPEAEEAVEKALESAQTLDRTIANSAGQTPTPFTMTLPEPPESDECEACDGGQSPVHDCPDCECECEDCNDTGRYTPRRRFRFDGFDVDEKYMRLLVDLPELKIDIKTVNYAGPILFTFASGEGLLMPMRRDSHRPDEQVIDLSSSRAANAQPSIEEAQADERTAEDSASA